MSLSARVAFLLVTGVAALLPGAVVSAPLRDSAGNQKYWILLNEQVAANESAGVEAPARSPRDPANSVDFYGWHKPSVRALVRRLERTLGIKAVQMTSHALPSFAAYASPSTAQLLASNPAVSEVIALDTDDVKLSALWSDQQIGTGEYIPWGKTAVGTSDSLTFSNGNIVYLLDGGAATHSDLNIILWAPVNTQCFQSASGHANHVAGIIGAQMNTGRVRGVNPGNPIINVNICNVDDLANTHNDVFDQSVTGAAMDWVLADANDRHIYAVANISANSIYFSEGYPLWRFVRRLSNRVLVVQSAGNSYGNACFSAYGKTVGPANGYDGILVVGGIDQDGREVAPPNPSDPNSFGYINSPVGYADQRGSNWGNCVEVWAPSKEVRSTWNTSAQAVEKLSGTSMAAPHVAALAARYGNSNTTPVERERYIRSKVFTTGYYDTSGQPIKVPSYTQGASEIIPSKLSIVSVTADSSAPGSSPANAVDANHATSWNAGHGTPGWIEFDLGTTRWISAIRMTPEMSPSSSSVVHNVYAGNTPAPTSLVKVFSETASMLEPIAGDVGTYARYVRIQTSTSPSWVAWREIEILGY